MLNNTRLFLEKYIHLLKSGEYEKFLEYLYNSNNISGIDGFGSENYLEIINIIKNAKIDILLHTKTFPKYYFYEDLNLISYIIPSNIETIDLYVFSNCKNLEKIIIPTSVKIIWTGAFNGCNNLKDIIYKGIKKEWITEVSVSIFNKPLLKNKIRCSDGDVRYNKDKHEWEPIIE